MIQLYTAPSCLSCRKVKKYFKDNNISFVEKNILNTKLHRDDILRMLISSENGFEDIISTRSKIFKDQGLDIDEMSTNALMEFIVKNQGKLENKMYTLPRSVDEEIARIKLDSMGIKIDTLTEEQERYLNTWSEGT